MAHEISRYLRIIQKWWWVTALLVVATLGTMTLIAFLTEKEYEATVTVQVNAPPPEEVPLYSQFGREALQDEIDQLQISLTEFLTAGDVVFTVLERLPEVTMSGGSLRDRISVEVPENSQLMRINVQAVDPDTAALLANTLVEVGLDEFGQLRAQPTANTRRFIELQIEAAYQELQQAENDLMQFQISNKVGRVDSAINSQYDLIRSLRMQGDLDRAAGKTGEADALRSIILERETELQNLIGLSAEYNELIDRVSRTRSTYTFLLDKKAEAQIKENQILESSSIQIIMQARSPRNPIALITDKIFILGAVGSILGGILLTFLLEFMSVSQTFRGIAEPPERPETIPLLDNSR
jgi:uncharacterized protein involved in exopolysaccharide biosynthesis